MFVQCLTHVVSRFTWVDSDSHKGKVLFCDKEFTQSSPYTGHKLQKLAEHPAKDHVDLEVFVREDTEASCFIIKSGPIGNEGLI